MASSPWYTYPMDSPSGTYGKIPDPFCAGSKICYLKPDVNVCAPGGTPITALASGTVTSVKSMFGAPSVTIALDTPYNSIATHAAYNFLGSSNVQAGQHVQAGQPIGSAKGGGGVCTAFALTADESYGGATFSQYNGDPRLNPYPILQALRAGKPLPTYTGSDTTSGVSSLPFGLGSAIPALQSTFINFSEEVAIFVIALVLVVMGVMLLAGKQIGGFTKDAIQT